MNNKVISIQKTAVKPTTPAPQLPETGFLRLNQIIGDDTHPPIIPVGKTTWYAGIKAGKFPKPIRLGLRTSAYRVEDIRALVESIAMGAA
jgi:prophage regulatory protein